MASACVRPADVTLAAAILTGSDVLVSTVVGFPHGSSTTATKVFEAERALADGANEFDMVLNIGRLRSAADDEVEADIRAVVEAVERGRCVKVILENAYLDDEREGTRLPAGRGRGAHFVKTSTGFAPPGRPSTTCACMRASVSPPIEIKAAGGVRALDALLEVMNVGVTRIGATATETIIQDFRARKAAFAAA